MRRHPVLPLMLILITLGLSCPAFGQVEDFYFSHWNMGLDARSLALGKTGLALVENSFASALNPAGLAGVKTIEFGLAGSYNHLLQSVEGHKIVSRPFGFNTQTEFLDISRKSLGFSPEFAALTLPLKIAGRALVFQVNYQRRVPFSMSSESHTSFDYRTRYHLIYEETIRTEGKNGFDRLSISTAFQPVKAIALGVTVSRWFGGATLPSVRTLSYTAENFYGLDGEWDEIYVNNRELSISGISVDGGLQILLGDRFRLGFIYRLGWTADVEYSNFASYSDSLTGLNTSGTNSGQGTVTMPSGIGIGLAIRIIKDLQLTMDYNRTFWTGRTVSDYSTVDAAGYTEERSDYLFPSMNPLITGGQTDSHHFGIGLEFLHEIKNGSLFFRQGFFQEAQHLFDDFGRQKRFWGLTMGPGVQILNFGFNMAAALSFGSHSYARDKVSDAPSGEKTEKSTLLILRSSLTFRF